MATTDIRVAAVETFLHPVTARVPLKFGNEVLTDVQVAHVEIVVEDCYGRRARGRGECPLNVQWAWPAPSSHEVRLTAMRDALVPLTSAWATFDEAGHAMEIGHAFDRHRLEAVTPGIPRLAALVCNAAFDVALHDAYGQLHGVDIYDTYTRPWLNRDLAWYYDDDPDRARFAGRYPADFLLARSTVRDRLPVWHLVGGLDPIDTSDLTGSEPRDGHPVLLTEWIRRDGLTCLKIKLRGNDPAWDLERLVRVGRVGLDAGVSHFCADFNGTVTDPAVVDGTLEQLAHEHPDIASRLLYVEQPFPSDLEAGRIDVHALAARVPLFLDESAHDWRAVRLGASLGWNGVALKTCKTQTGALLSHCWARAHGMQIMVQDLTNPMLALIPHVRLAAHTGTIMGVECNAAQFYPEGSAKEAAVHPGLYARRKGVVDLSTLGGAGFGYGATADARHWRTPIARAGQAP